MSEESRGSREAEMTAARARMWRAFAVGWLFLTSSCAQDPSSGGAAGTVVFGPTPGFEMIKDAVPDKNLVAMLKIDGGPETPMNVDQTTGVPSLAVSLPAGNHTFLISYSIPHAKAPDGLLLGEASATREITANIPDEVKDELKLITTDTSDPDLRFDKDRDGASNLFEIRVGTDPFNGDEKPIGAKQVAAGGSHSCALIDDGTVRCWGLNDKGQLGNNSTINSTTPVSVLNEDGKTPLTGVTAVATGASHTCAILKSIRMNMKCWGSNSFGQLGDNSTTDRLTPVFVLNPMGPLPGVEEVATGQDHTCVRRAENVQCWGRNNRGQLGNNSTTNSAIPVSVLNKDGTLFTKVTSISAGAFHTCAVQFGQDIRCWGDNSSMKLGLDSSIGQSTSPAAPVAFPSGTSSYQMGSLTAGGQHTCVLLFPDPSGSDGGVWCWGSNIRAQLGQPRTQIASSKDPLFVENITPGATSAEAGTNHTCAKSGLSIDGTVRCWGDNSNGQLGVSITDISAATPVLVSGISTASSVAAGSSHSCALLDSGAVWCWGRNNAGQLGNGTTGGDSPTPVQVKGLQAVFQDALP